MIPIITERAASDIQSIFEFHGQTSAQSIVNEMLVAINDLETFPMYGRSRDELKKGLRSFVIRKYVVLYAIWQETPVVVRVLHGSRDIEGMFAVEQ